MPVTIKRPRSSESLDLPTNRIGDTAEGQLAGRGGTTNSDRSVAVTVFVQKANWFVLSQTEGKEYIPAEVPQWSERQALHALSIDRVPFIHPNGNCQGYACERNVAVSPIATLPHKTLFHEIAHVLLSHTEQGSGRDDHELTPQDLREVEAECVALICCESLGLGGVPECRGYIQSWLGKKPIPERSAQRIFKAADQILKAGRPEKAVIDDPAAKPSFPSNPLP